MPRARSFVVGSQGGFAILSRNREGITFSDTTFNLADQTVVAPDAPHPARDS
jgi:hypothetical protein